MAHTSNSDDGVISGINVTPLVDVVLVLLVVLMVTATYIASRTIPVDLPKGATGEATQIVLAVTVDERGDLYLDGRRTSESEFRRRVRSARDGDPGLRAVIAADTRVRHGRVVRVIDVLRQERVTQFAINVQPSDLENEEASPPK
jgi:biopolymer transport protein ExbD